jgi:hypothetical protein
MEENQVLEGMENDTATGTETGTADGTDTAPAMDYKSRYEALLAGVHPEMLDDAITLAKGRVSDIVTFSEAIGSVIGKYPYFGAEKRVSEITTGIRTGGNCNPLSGVEAEFLSRNPGIKL